MRRSVEPGSDRMFDHPSESIRGSFRRSFQFSAWGGRRRTDATPRLSRAFFERSFGGSRRRKNKRRLRDNGWEHSDGWGSRRHKPSETTGSRAHEDDHDAQVQSRSHRPFNRKVDKRKSLQMDLGRSRSTRGFDPLALLRRLPVKARAFVTFRSLDVDKSRLASWSGWALGRVRGFDKVLIELRGRLVVIVDKNAISWASRDPDMEAGVIGLFTVERTTVSRTKGGRGLTLDIRRVKAQGSVTVRFSTEEECSQWEKALVKAAAERVVGLSDFEFIAPIGKGASGKVFLVKDRITGERLALKVIGKTRVYSNKSGFRHAFDERLALELTDGHPFFTRLRYAFQTRKNFYLAIDFYQGGDLFQYLKTHGGRLEEGQARIVLAEVILALEHMHKMGFVYRDLKPENVLLDNKGHVRLADFGLCKKLDSGLTATICGTHTYAAPEMLALKQYGTSVDFWALGTFLYHIVRGRTPYEARDLDQVIYNMNNRMIRFSTSCSPEMVSIIKALLEWAPESRLGCGIGGIEALKQHPFFESLDWKLTYLRAPNRDGLFEYRARQRRLERSREQENLEMIKKLVKRDIPLREQQEFQKRLQITDGKTVPVAPVTEDVLPLTSSISSCTPESDSTDSDSDDSWHGEAWRADDLYELRNFDLSEWHNVEVDKDLDDPFYGDSALWPVSKSRRRIRDIKYMAGYSYTSPNLIFHHSA